MGKKDKVDPAEGAEVAPEYQAGVLAMARARMEASNADAEQGLAEAAAQTQRQRAAHAGLEEELAEVREDARDQYFFLQQQLDADFERIAALERRAVVDGVELDRAERHHKARLARSQASHEEAIRAQTRREEDARAALAAARKELSLPRPDDFVEEAEVEEVEPPPPAVEARKTSKWRAALVTPALERMLAPETLPAPPPAPDAASITAAAARYDFPTGDAYDRARAARARAALRARRADLEQTLAKERTSWERFRIRAKEESRRDVARRAEAAAKKNTNVSAEQITRDVDDAHRQKHEELKLSTRALKKMIRAHRAACDRRRVLFNEVCVAEDTARQAEAALEVEEEFPASPVPSTASSDKAVSPPKPRYLDLAAVAPGEEPRPRPQQHPGALLRLTEKDAQTYALRVQMLRRRGAAQLAAADAVVALVSKCAVDARADAETEARLAPTAYDGLDAVFPPSRPGSRAATAQKAVVYPRRAAALAAQDRAALLGRLAAAAHAHRVALRPFVEETVDAIRGGDVLLGSPGSPEPSTARSQLSQSSVASSLSAFSVASSRRKQQRDFFSPVQVLPRVARRR